MMKIEEMIKERKKIQCEIEAWTRVINSKKIMFYGDGCSPNLSEEQQSELRGLAHGYRGYCVEKSRDMDAKLKAIEELLSLT